MRAWPDVSQLALDVPDGYYTPGDSYGFAFTIESMGSLQRFSPGASTLAALERVVGDQEEYEAYEECIRLIQDLPPPLNFPGHAQYNYDSRDDWYIIV